MCRPLGIDVYWSPSCPINDFGASSQAQVHLGSLQLAMTNQFNAFSLGSGAFTLPTQR